MNKKPLILVTNDDGITSKGIRKLVKTCKKIGEVVVVAPDSPQSGMGHAITVNNTLRIKKSQIFKNIESYTCSGTPADCVKLAIREILKKKPDLVVSGINHGSNCSTNVLYSGTMSAAVEASMQGIDAIGFSLMDFDSEANFKGAVKYVKPIIIKVLKNKLPKGVCLNVNVPKLELKELKGVKICRQANACWQDTFDKRKDPFGQEYFWLKGTFKNFDKKSDADIVNLEKGYVTIVPVQFDLTAYEFFDKIKKMNF